MKLSRISGLSTWIGLWLPSHFRSDYVPTLVIWVLLNYSKCTWKSGLNIISPNLLLFHRILTFNLVFINTFNQKILFLDGAFTPGKPQKVLLKHHFRCKAPSLLCLWHKNTLPDQIKEKLMSQTNKINNFMLQTHESIHLVVLMKAASDYLIKRFVAVN